MSLCVIITTKSSFEPSTVAEATSVLEMPGFVITTLVLVSGVVPVTVVVVPSPHVPEPPLPSPEPEPPPFPEPVLTTGAVVLYVVPLPSVPSL